MAVRSGGEMAPVDFVTTVNWPVNPGVQKTEPFRIDVPGGVPKSALRSPKYVDVPGMSAAKRSGSSLATGSSGGLGSTAGLVTANLSVRFDDPDRQWRARPMNGENGPVEFSFQGGKVHIGLDLAIFVLDPYKPVRGDTISAKIFSVIYSHELLHVWDYLDMYEKWFLAKLKQEPFTDKYLVSGKPYVWGLQRESARQLIADFPKHITAKIDEEAQYVWGTESNRRQAIRDAPAEYRKVQEKVGGLRSSRNIPGR